jgi:Acetyltransferase (GNAT) domain
MAMKARIISGIDELRAQASAWDELWMASDVTDPTARAELIAQWMECFGKGSRFVAAIVEDDGQLVAALPLYEQKIRGVVRGGYVPANAWAHGGGLLVRDQGTARRSLNLLVQKMDQLPWPVVWLERVRICDPGYLALQEALSGSKIAASVFPQYQTGIINTTGKWEDYLASLDRHMRANIRRNEKLLTAAGEFELQIVSDDADGRLEEKVRHAFEMENKSWKGNAGSSVIQRGRLAFYLRQAKTLANWQQLSLRFLVLNGKPVSFQYGYLGKDTFHGCKTSYDSEFASMGVGQTLYRFSLQQCFEDPAIARFDNLGEMTETIGRWRPEIAQVGQIVLAANGFLGRMTVHAHARWWPWIRKALQRRRAGGARFSGKLHKTDGRKAT